MQEPTAAVKTAPLNRAERIPEKIRVNLPDRLTREMCTELIEFVTVDECPGRYSKEPREIHIYYKLIDKNADIPQYRHKSETSEDI